MARLPGIVLTSAEVACVAATAKTVLQLIAPTNQRLALQSWWISFDGISPTAEPVVVELVKQTTAGTVTSVTPVHKKLGASETLQATAGKNATVEPTTSDILHVDEVHPQTGRKFNFSFDDEFVLGGGTRIAIRVTAPANVNCLAGMEYEE